MIISNCSCGFMIIIGIITHYRRYCCVPLSAAIYQAFTVLPWRASLQPSTSSNDLGTVDGSEIPSNHLGCIKPRTVNNGINYLPQLVSLPDF